jgi:exodeoxyribonuclease-5
MLQNELFFRLTSTFPHTVTDDQKAAFAIFAEFCYSDAYRPVMILNGYAGTGKTSLLAHISDVLESAGKPAVLMASTGRAAKVLSSFCGKNAYTIHKKIYRQKSFSDSGGTFVLNANLGKGKIFIVDEASMIQTHVQDSQIFGSGNLLSDLVDFVFSNEGCRLVITGDNAQLPPVNESVSPALNPAVLESLGCTVFHSSMKQITRQSLGSGILVNATRIRTMAENGIRGDLKLTANGFEDVERVSGADLQYAIENSYEKYGRDETVVICRSNKQANKYNHFIRNRILFREDALSSSDKLLVVKNNYFWLPENEHSDFIANGDFLTLRKIRRVKELYGFRFADCQLEFTDYKLEFDAMLLMESLESDGPGITKEQAGQLYQSIAADYAHIKDKRKRYKEMLEDKHFNALQTKMGYAMTCHKSQGGQWKAVFVDFSFAAQEISETEVLRWLYTAVTRATEKLYLVNFNDRFFE